MLRRDISHKSKAFNATPFDLSHSRTHTFKHYFSDCPDEICIRGKDINSTNHFLFQCSLFLIKT